ncbi:MAG: hypothetical protein JW776_11515 [Candidatus Lokiarchaeota archaeon]|nr:hypothetical protein [Candidatus Lokiarchaeota archaeon]
MDSNEAQLFSRTTEPIKDNQCFVLMPFDPQYLEIYEDVIKPLLSELGINCVRADELYGSRAIIQDIWKSIQIAGLIIADMTEKNPNVFYELGLSHAIGKKVILITQSIEDVPFDLRHLRCIVYEHNLRGAIKLKEQLRKTITNDSYIYSQIPVNILTDRFTGGFSSKFVDHTIRFLGHRGEKTRVEESCSITAEHDNLHQFYRKLQLTGKILAAEADNATIDIKQIFVGMNLLSIGLPKNLMIGDTHEFKVSYEIENNFPDEREYWFYNAEVKVKEFHTSFIFPRELGVQGFSVFLKNENAETQVDRQPNNKIDGDDVIYLWSIEDIGPPECYIFRWNWK